MTAPHRVASTASCSHLFTGCYGEFTCGNATVTAPRRLVVALSTVTANLLLRSNVGFLNKTSIAR